MHGQFFQPHLGSDLPPPPPHTPLFLPPLPQTPSLQPRPATEDTKLVKLVRFHVPLGPCQCSLCFGFHSALFSMDDLRREGPGGTQTSFSELRCHSTHVPSAGNKIRCRSGLARVQRCTDRGTAVSLVFT